MWIVWMCLTGFLVGYAIVQTIILIQEIRKC